MRPHKLNKKTLPGFVEKNVCKVQKKHISLHPAIMVQQIKFIIHTNIQPLPALFFTQGQGHRSKVKVKDLKKFLVTR